MRSTLIVLAASLLSLLGLTSLGLGVADEAMVRAPTATGPDRDPVVVDPGRIAVPVAFVGPVALVGPRPPGAPRLRLASTEDPAATPTIQPVPTRLRVDEVGIDAPIVATGVDGSGDLDVPGPDDVGWYEHGPVPGADGSAVLAAHVDLGGREAVFFRLDRVDPGDHLDVDFDDGSRRRFEVVENVLYDKAALPSDTLFRRGGPPLLRLITCGGRYDPASHHYLGNRVVTAVPVG